jgi:hypothetical protein
METNKILSFEEFATRGTDTATAEAPTTDTAIADVKTDTTDAADTETQEPVVDTEEETTDTEETTDAEETEEETTEEAEEMTNDSEETMTVAEMYKKAHEMMQNEAAAYEADDYEEHTKESYMKDTATLAAEAHCNAIEEMYEKEDMTKEAYEAACNSIKEAYEKKCNEACETYGTTENERPENEPMNGPADSIIVKSEN